MKKAGEIIKIEADKKADRLDKFLAERLPSFSRSQLQRLIAEGRVSINGEEIVKTSREVKPADLIILEIPPPDDSGLEPVELGIKIIYQDRDLAVINKPAGLVVHPAGTHEGPTLVEGLLAQLDNLSGIGGELRPGIVHRLDKNTTGIMVVAKNDSSHRKLSRQFKERSVKKFYRTIVGGHPEHDRARIEAPIGRDPVNRKKMTVLPDNSKPAVSRYQVLEKYPGFSELQVELLTGRTHQIRVHMEFLGHSILGDRKYGGQPRLKSGGKGLFEVKRPMLHAWQLGFLHPGSEKFIEFEAELPEDYLNLKQYLASLSSI